MRLRLKHTIDRLSNLAVLSRTQMYGKRFPPGGDLAGRMRLSIAKMEECHDMEGGKAVQFTCLDFRTVTDSARCHGRAAALQRATAPGLVTSCTARAGMTCWELMNIMRGEMSPVWSSVAAAILGALYPRADASARCQPLRAGSGPGHVERPENGSLRVH